MSRVNKVRTITITCDGGSPITVIYRLFVKNSEKFANENNKEEYKNGIDFGNEYSYDSILQFFKAIQDEEPKITEQNAFEYSLLCDVWEVMDEVRAYKNKFFKECNKDLLIPQLLFLLRHNQDGQEQIDNLKAELPNYVTDPNLKDLDFDILLKIVNFKNVQQDDDSFKKVFDFCLDYLDEHRNDENCSKLFSTLNVSKLSIEDQRELESRPYFDRSVLNDSIGKSFSNIDVGIQKILDYINEKKESETHNEIVQVNPSLYYPDYSTINNRGWSNYTTPNDTWIFCYAATSNYSSPSSVRIQNKKTFAVAGCNSYYGASSITVPIRANQNIVFTASSSTNQQAYFAPFKTNYQIVSLPNYSAAIPKIWNNRNFAECDGWIYACSGAAGDSAYIKLNDSKVLYFSYHGNSYNSFGSILIPISRGESYFAYHACNPHSLQFIPGLENSQTGFPDYDKEVNLTWGEEYIATEPGWVYAQCITINCNSNNIQYSPAYLTINGNAFVISQINVGYQMVSSLFMPISKGDKCCATGGNSGMTITFMPFIKE